MTKVELVIVARKETVGQPWMCRLCKEYDLQVNLIKASIDPDYGWALVQLEGPLEEIQRATAWLMTTGLSIDAQQRAVGA